MPFLLKACIAKHIAQQLEWNDLVHLACDAYNFMPNEHSKESPFFLMYTSHGTVTTTLQLSLEGTPSYLSIHC